MKNSNDAIGNWTRDLPPCSSVPQPNAPLHAPGGSSTINIYTQTIHRTTHILTYLSCFVTSPAYYSGDPGTTTRPAQMGFVVRKLTQPVLFLQTIKLSPISITPPTLHAQSLICHTCYTSIASDSIIQYHIYSSYSWYSNLQVLQQSSEYYVNPQPQFFSFL